jgi:hypothetical protein
VFNQGHALIIGTDYTEQYPESGTYQYVQSQPTGTYHLALFGVPVSTFGSTAGSSAAAFDYILIQDQKTSGTQGGTFTAGSWQVRDLNTEVADTGNHASISSNQITLDAGTYEVLISAPAFNVIQHQARLYDTTGAAVLCLGQNALAHQGGFPNTTTSIVQGRFTLSVQSVLQVEHQCASTAATTGLGVANGWGTEIYTTIRLTKVG